MPNTLSGINDIKKDIHTEQSMKTQRKRISKCSEPLTH